MASTDYQYSYSPERGAGPATNAGGAYQSLWESAYEPNGPTEATAPGSSAQSGSAPNPFQYLSGISQYQQELNSLSSLDGSQVVSIQASNGSYEQVPVSQLRTSLQGAIANSYSQAISAADSVDPNAVQAGLTSVQSQLAQPGLDQATNQQLNSEEEQLLVLRHSPSALRFAYAQFLYSQGDSGDALQLMNQAGQIDSEAAANPNFQQFYQTVASSAQQGSPETSGQTPTEGVAPTAVTVPDGSPIPVAGADATATAPGTDSPSTTTPIATTLPGDTPASPLQSLASQLTEIPADQVQAFGSYTSVIQSATKELQGKHPNKSQIEKQLQGAVTDADKIDQKAVQHDQQIIDEMLKKNPDAATKKELDQYQSELKSMQEAPAASRILLGQVQLSDKKYSAAKKNFEDAEKLDPDFANQKDIDIKKLIGEAHAPSFWDQCLHVAEDVGEVAAQVVGTAVGVVAGAVVGTIIEPGGGTIAGAIAGGALFSAGTHDAIDAITGKKITLGGTLLAAGAGAVAGTGFGLFASAGLAADTGVAALESGGTTLALTGGDTAVTTATEAGAQAALPAGVAAVGEGGASGSAAGFSSASAEAGGGASSLAGDSEVLEPDAIYDAQGNLVWQASSGMSNVAKVGLTAGGVLAGSLVLPPLFKSIATKTSH